MVAEIVSLFLAFCKLKSEQLLVMCIIIESYMILDLDPHLGRQLFGIPLY